MCQLGSFHSQSFSPAAFYFFLIAIGVTHISSYIFISTSFILSRRKFYFYFAYQLDSLCLFL